MDVNENICGLIKAMAKLGLRHATIAQSLGMSPHVLRQYFARELLQAATEAELEALAASQHSAALVRLKFQQPKPPNHRDSKPVDIPDLPPPHNNDGEPNYPF